MTREELKIALKKADIRAHMKAAVSVTSPLCELETAILEASNALEEEICRQLNKYCEDPPKTDYD